MVQNENSYMMNLVRFAHNGNDGMVEYWNDGLAPFGQNLAPLRPANGAKTSFKGKAKFCPGIKMLTIDKKMKK